ncbi:MAG: DUF6382 domain-containing protein [Lachnospiraceae bacterium]|nr:DUF6382 domain-containing protein [Lachnospiraceae bacterium]
MSINARYDNGINGSMMIIEDDKGTGSGYIAGMLTCNHIPGLLVTSLSYTDGVLNYVYDTSHMVSLASLYDGRDIGYAGLYALIGSLVTAMGSMEDHLLPFEHLILDREYIYVEPVSGRASFCYFPGTYSSVEGSLNGFAEYILQKVDSKDDMAIALAYDLYKQVTVGDYALKSLLTRPAVEEDDGKEEFTDHIVIEDGELYPPEDEGSPVIPFEGRIIIGICAAVIFMISGFALAAALKDEGVCSRLLMMKEMKVFICVSAAMAVFLAGSITLKWFNETGKYKERVIRYDDDTAKEAMRLVSAGG